MITFKENKFIRLSQFHITEISLQNKNDKGVKHPDKMDTVAHELRRQISFLLFQIYGLSDSHQASVVVRIAAVNIHKYF